MNYSSICYIDNYGKIEIPGSILRPLLAGVNRILWCVYSAKDEQNLNEPYNRSLRYGIIITPIPPSLWPLSARLIIALSEKPGALYALADFLSQNKISIICAEGSRANQQYSTWSLHIAFEDQNRPSNYLTQSEVYEEIKIKSSDLEKALKLGGTKVPIFKKDSEIDYNNYVSVTPNTELHYMNKEFENFKEELETIRIDLSKVDFALSDDNFSNSIDEDEMYHRIWFQNQQEWIRIRTNPIILSVQKAKINGNYFLSSKTYTDFEGAPFNKDSKSFMFKSTNDLEKLFEKINEDEKVSILDTYAFCELDIKSFFIRLSVIPKENQKCFFRINITFENKHVAGKSHSCLGLTSKMAEIIYQNKYNIINSSSYTTFYYDTLETGDMVYFLEDYLLKIETDEKEFLERANLVFNAFKLNSLKLPSTITILSCHVEQLCKINIEIS